MKKRIYGKEREKVENDLEDINDQLSDAYGERADIFQEQDIEAGEKGENWSDEDANRYGTELNKIEDKIATL